MATEILEARAPAGRPVAGLGGPDRPRPRRPRRWRRRAEVGFDPAQFGLWAFLGTVTMMFIGFTSAYIVRRTGADWRPLPAPSLLCWNTAALLLSSAALEVARRRRAVLDLSGLRRWLRRHRAARPRLRGRPAPGLAPAVRARLLPLLEPAQLVLLPAQRRAPRAPGRAGSSGSRWCCGACAGTGTRRVRDRAPCPSSRRIGTSWACSGCTSWS